MKIKNTDELNKILDKNIPIEQYLSDYSDSLSDSELSDILNCVLKENHLEKAQVIADSGINERYGYSIFSGKKKHPTRDILICLCIGLKANEVQTKAILHSINEAPLYSKNPRDAVILFGIKHKLSIMEIETMLYDNGFPVLYEPKSNNNM